ncbi:MAG: hypothetical protein CTY27_04235 [Methylotenera sp.]|nr:MAG: hypothetical protein CTY27_04235 [Methylotenera sp.]
MDKPKIIYKYQNFSSESLRNLKAQSLYFSSPLKFNDPYDCAISAGIKDLTDSEVNTVREAYIKKNDVPLQVKEEFASLNNNNLRFLLHKIAEDVITRHRNDFLKNRGVTCFSEKNDDLLMWSHYGGRYRGFCLAFSTEFEPFHKMKQVEYQVDMPKIDLIPILLNDDYEQIIQLFCTKSKSWEYQKEWRCIHNVAGMLFGYESNSLKAIYFGPDIELASLEIICLILRGQNESVELWQGTRSPSKFEVNFKKFDYKSYLKAKKLGLR